MDQDTIRDQIRLLTLVESTSQVTDAQLNTIINQGLYEIGAASDWPFLYTSSTLSLVASTRTVALPATFQRYVVLVDDDVDQALPFLSPDVFFSRYGNDTGNTTTSPSFWTIYGTNIYFSPIPSANDTNRYTLYFYRGITPLTAGTDEPEFNDAFHYALVEYGKSKLYEREEYYQEAERALESFSSYIEDMVAFYSRRGDITPAIAGEGTRYRRGDPNLPWWNRL